MSLTTDIAALVARADALITTFESKETAIDNAVAAAIAAVPSLSRTFHVDAVLGKDTNSGEVGAPLQTIARAVALTPIGGFGLVRLLTDFHVATDVVVDGKDITIISHSEAIRRRLTFERHVAPDGTRVLSGFPVARGASLSLRNLTIEMPDSIGYQGAPLGYAAIIRPWGGTSGVLLTAIKIIYCDVDLPAVPFGALIDGYSGAPTTLYWLANTMLDQGPTGRLFRGYNDTGTGTSVASLPWLISNLTAI